MSQVITTEPTPSGVSIPGPPTGIGLDTITHTVLVARMLFGRDDDSIPTAANIEARNELLAAYEPWIRGVAAKCARTVTTDQHVIDEATAESLLRCTERLTEYDPRGGVPLGAWLIAARIISHDLPVGARLRDHASLDEPVGDESSTRLGDLLVSPAAGPCELVEDTDPFLELLLQSLTTEQEKVVRLKTGTDGRPALTTREVAELLDLTTDAVERRWQRAIRSIRRTLRAAEPRQQVGDEGEHRGMSGQAVAKERPYHIRA